MSPYIRNLLSGTSECVPTLFFSVDYHPVHALYKYNHQEELTFKIQTCYCRYVHTVIVSKSVEKIFGNKGQYRIIKCIYKNVHKL